MAAQAVQLRLEFKVTGFGVPSLGFGGEAGFALVEPLACRAVAEPEMAKAVFGLMVEVEAEDIAAGPEVAVGFAVEFNSLVLAVHQSLADQGLAVVFAQPVVETPVFLGPPSGRKSDAW